MKKRDEILVGAREAFFHAMSLGWASGSKAAAKKIDVTGSSGGEETAYITGLLYRNEWFRVVDRYCVSEAGKSAGTTTIWFHHDPVWFMSYGGSYLKEDIPFLKNALMRVYSTKQFFGGRGPTSLAQGVSHLKDGVLVYANEIEKDSTFDKFRGKEAIIGPVGIRGQHEYWGMALI